MTPTEFDPVLQDMAIELVEKAQAAVREALPLDGLSEDEAEALIATYTMNALLINAYTIAAHYDIPPGVLARAVRINYENHLSAQEETDNALIH